MSALPAVLSQLADRLRVNGAQFSPRPLEIMSAAMSFLQAIGNPLDDDVATAAYAASQLMSDDAKQVAITLGVSPDLVPTLARAASRRRLATSLNSPRQKQSASIE
jgi:hypothetical protein